MADTGESCEVELCKGCSKNVSINGSKCVKCVNCGSYYHSSCSQRIKGVTVDNAQKNLILCCSGTGGGSVPTPEPVSSVGEVHKVENLYLKSLLREKEERIVDLLKVNKLLEYKISKLEEQLDFGLSVQVNKKGNNDKRVVNQGKLPLDVDKKKIQKNIEIDREGKQIMQDVNKQIIANKQLEVMNELINLEAPVSPDPQQNVSEFKLVTRKHRKRDTGVVQRVSDDDLRRKPVKITIGTGVTNTECSFKARPRKMWLYVGRVDESAGKEHVEQYIKEKCNIVDSRELDVEPLNTVGRSAAFKVGIDPKYFETVKECDFWPSGILVRRFKFQAKRLDRQSSGNFLDRNFAGPENQMP